MLAELKLIPASHMPPTISNNPAPSGRKPIRAKRRLLKLISRMTAMPMKA